MLVMAIRTIILYAIVLIIIRIMGKRELGQLQPFEFVVAIMIADLVSIPMSNTGIPIFYGIVPVLTLLIAHLTISQLSLKSIWFRNLTCGRPTIVILKGKVQQRVMKSLRYNLDDLFEQLRENDIFAITDVEYAILETSGKLSLLLKTQRRTPNIGEMRNLSEVDDKIRIPRNVVIDGVIDEQELQYSEYTDIKLNESLDKLGYTNLRDIFICTTCGDEIIYIQQKERTI